MFRPLKTLWESFCCSGAPSSPATFFFAYLVNFSTSRAQPNAPLYEGELTVFLHANTVWNNVRYGIQLFCCRGVFTYLLSLLEPYENRGCGGLARVDVKQMSVQGVDRGKNKGVDVINYQLPPATSLGNWKHVRDAQWWNRYCPSW